MSTSVNVNELPSPQDRPKRLAEGGRGAVIVVLIAIGLVCLVVNGIYPGSGSEELGKDVGQFFVGP